MLPEMRFEYSEANSEHSAWLNYYAAKLRLYRELGVMKLDQDGRWIETSLDDLGVSVPLNGEGTEALPPMVPAELYEAALQREPEKGQARGLIASVLDRIGIRKITRPKHDHEVRQVSAELAALSPKSAESRASHAEPEQLPKSASSQPTIRETASRQSPTIQPIRHEQKPRRSASDSAESFKRPAASKRIANDTKRSKVSKVSLSTKGWVATKPEK